MNIQLKKRDVDLLLFLFKFKVATFKQIRKSVFKVSEPTASLRLKKLRKVGLIKIVGKTFKESNSLVFGLSKNGFKLLLQKHPNLCFIEKYNSYSADHDIALVDIANKLSSMKNVQSYWPENVIQSSKQFTDDEKLSRYREFNFDGLIRFNSQESGTFIFGLEYECSQKGEKNYRMRLTNLYNHSRPQAILYICETQSIERTIKNVEKEVATDKVKKLYFIQYSEFIKGEESVTFKNQDGHAIVIKK